MSASKWKAVDIHIKGNIMGKSDAAICLYIYQTAGWEAQSKDIQPLNKEWLRMWLQGASKY